MKEPDMTQQHPFQGMTDEEVEKYLLYRKQENAKIRPYLRQLRDKRVMVVNGKLELTIMQESPSLKYYLLSWDEPDINLELTLDIAKDLCEGKECSIGMGDTWFKIKAIERENHDRRGGE